MRGRIAESRRTFQRRWFRSEGRPCVFGCIARNSASSAARTGINEGSANNALLVSGASAVRAGTRRRTSPNLPRSSSPKARGVGNRNAAFQHRRALRVTYGKQAASESEDGDKKSQRTAHILTNTAPEVSFPASRGHAFLIRENSRKANGPPRGNQNWLELRFTPR